MTAQPRPGHHDARAASWRRPRPRRYRAPSPLPPAAAALLPKLHLTGRIGGRRCARPAPQPPATRSRIPRSGRGAPPRRRRKLSAARPFQQGKPDSPPRAPPPLRTASGSCTLPLSGPDALELPHLTQRRRDTEKRRRALVEQAFRACHAGFEPAYRRASEPIHPASSPTERVLCGSACLRQIGAAASLRLQGIALLRAARGRYGKG